MTSDIECELSHVFFFCHISDGNAEVTQEDSDAIRAQRIDGESFLVNPLPLSSLTTSQCQTSPCTHQLGVLRNLALNDRKIEEALLQGITVIIFLAEALLYQGFGAFLGKDLVGGVTILLSLPRDTFAIEKPSDVIRTHCAGTTLSLLSC